MQERKQAEFLVENSFPWKWIGRIGVIDNKVEGQVAEFICRADYKPKIVVDPSWYY